MKYIIFVFVGLLPWVAFGSSEIEKRFGTTNYTFEGSGEEYTVDLSKSRKKGAPKVEAFATSGNNQDGEAELRFGIRITL